MRVVGILAVVMALGVAVTAQQAGVATTIARTEGPTVDRQGNVYFTDRVAPRILKLASDGTLTVFRDNANWPNGLVIDNQGRLIAVEGSSYGGMMAGFAMTPRVTRTDLATGRVEILADGPFKDLNDVTIDGAGRLYATDQDGNAIYRIDGPGRVALVASGGDVLNPNGIQIAPDDRTLYVVVNVPSRAGSRRILAYPLSADGTVGAGRTLFQFVEGPRPDGMSVDVEGNLYAAVRAVTPPAVVDPRNGVFVISPTGRLLKTIPIPDDQVSNTAFGGPDMKTLYVTGGKSVFKIQSDIAGLAR